GAGVGAGGVSASAAAAQANESTANSFRSEGAFTPAFVADAQRPFDPGSCWSDAELMQKRWPVGRGPSSKTCPRWPPQRAQVTSVRTIPWEASVSESTRPSAMGWVKLGQPVPESNFVSELNSGAPHPAHA